MLDREARNRLGNALEGVDNEFMAGAGIGVAARAGEGMKAIASGKKGGASNRPVPKGETPEREHKTETEVVAEGDDDVQLRCLGAVVRSERVEK